MKTNVLVCAISVYIFLFLANSNVRAQESGSSIWMSAYATSGFKAGGAKFYPPVLGFGLGRGIAHDNLGINLDMIISDSYLSLDSVTHTDQPKKMSSLKGMFTLNIPERWSKTFAGPAIGTVWGVGFTPRESGNQKPVFGGVMLQFNANWTGDLGNKDTGRLRFGFFARCIYHLIKEPGSDAGFKGSLDFGIHMGLKPYSMLQFKTERPSDNRGLFSCLFGNKKVIFMSYIVEQQYC